jgi:hypothetical protein
MRASPVPVGLPDDRFSASLAAALTALNPGGLRIPLQELAAFYLGTQPRSAAPPFAVTWMRAALAARESDIWVVRAGMLGASVRWPTLWRTRSGYLALAVPPSSAKPPPPELRDAYVALQIHALGQNFLDATVASVPCDDMEEALREQKSTMAAAWAASPSATAWSSLVVVPP